MSAVVFDGKKFVNEREKVLQRRIIKLGFSPKLVNIFFAEDPGSVLYTNLKQQAAERVGIAFHAEEISLKDDYEFILRTISQYSHKKGIHGVMIQKPSKRIVIETVGVGNRGFEAWWSRMVVEIDPKRDVDCLTAVNLDQVYRGDWKIVPATVRAILSILDQTRTILEGRKVVVVGRSAIVGKPLAQVLAQRGAKVSLCGLEGVVAENLGSQMVKVHEPKDLASVAHEADILVSATGTPGIITAKMIKKEAMVIDVGAPVGDVEFAEVKKKASFITPVPGGIGPVTVVSLLENLVDISEI